MFHCLFFCCCCWVARGELAPTDYKFKIRNNESSTSPKNPTGPRPPVGSENQTGKKGPRSQSGSDSVRAHALRVILFYFFLSFSFFFCCFILTQLWGIGRAKLTIIKKKEKEQETEIELH
jgi:hypothetical protein